MRKLKRTLALLLAAILCLSCAAGSVSAERTAAAGKEQTRTRPVSTCGADEAVRVIVLLEGEPAAKASPAVRGLAEAKLAVQHAALRRNLEDSGLRWEENYEYRTLLNGLALTVPMGEVEGLSALPGVRSVHIANHYAPPETVQMETSNEMTGAAWMHESGFSGSGAVIAVLDTGITPAHEAFGVYDGMLSRAKLSEAQAEAQIAALGYGSCLSEKIPFAYDYYDQDDDATDDWSGHGTHVAGIVAGFARTEEGSVRFCGTAPDAQLLVMKIFSSETDVGTDSSVYFKALEDACLLGADVINLSIGAPNGFTWDQELEDEVFGDIYETLRAQGVSVVVSAGNEGSMGDGSSNWGGPGTVTADYADYGVLGSPASYGGNLAVASAENRTYPLNALRAGDRLIPIFDSTDGFYRAFYQPGEPAVEYVSVPGFGRPEDYAGLMIEGRIALVSRGELTFQEKLEAAAAAGAAGLLVYNSEPGELYMYIESPLIPSAAITMEDGAYLISRTVAVDPPAQPAPSSDSGEDLGTVYYRVGSQEEVQDGSGYLIVCESAGLAFNAAYSSVNEAGNGIPVTISAASFPFTELLHKAELRLAYGNLISDRGTLCCGGTVNEVKFSDSAENLTITVSSGGKAEIVCNACSFRYDSADSAFRFYLPGSSLIGDPEAKVALYRLGKAKPGVPTMIGTLTFPAETVSVENPAGGQPSSFSSMGVTPELGLKPTLTGVGGNVYSAMFGTEDGYTVLSGTSMAAPNVSGALACLQEYLAETRPELDRRARMELAEALLKSTAQVLTDADGRICSPRKQGAGLIDLQAAVEARAVITEPVLSLGDSAEGSFTLSFELRSLSDRALTYSLDLTALRDLCEAFDLDEDGEADGVCNALLSRNVSRGVSLVGERTVVLPAGETVTVELELAVSPELLAELREDFPNGGWLDGYLSLSEATPACDGGTDCPGNGIKDMPPVGNWAHPGIDFVLSRGLFKGVTKTKFKPEDTMTRGMMVTVLYKLAGTPPVTGPNPFKDVEEGKYYAIPVIWAAENGIVSGVSATRFKPENDVTREQMALILYRYAEYAGLDVDLLASLDAYPDVDTVHSYAYTAMRWAVGAGVLSGVKSGKRTLLKPLGNATRAQVATMFMSFVRNCVEPSALNSEVHVSFTGFVGDWSAAPILEQHDWREIVDLINWLETEPADEDGNTFAQYGYTYLDAADFAVNTDVNKAWALNASDLAGRDMPTLVYLGDNPWGYVDYSADRAAISPAGWLNTLWIQPMLLRNARHLIMTVTDAATGELYAVDDTEYLPKAVWDEEFGYWQATGEFIFDGTDLDGKALPGGTKVDVRFYANLAWGEDALGAIAYADLAESGAEYLEWEFSLTVDDAAPTAEDLLWSPQTRKLSFTLADDQYLAYAELTPMPLVTEDEYEVYPPVWKAVYAADEAGEAETVTLGGVDPGEYTLTVVDYAGNETAIRLALGSSAELCELHFVCPEGCAPEGAELWYVSLEGSVTMPRMTGEPEEGSFFAWLPEPLAGVCTYEELVDAALDEEIRLPGKPTEIWGETWFYALLTVPEGYITAQD